MVHDLLGFGAPVLRYELEVEFFDLGGVVIRELGASGLLGGDQDVLHAIALAK